jgi:hypothetical protein
LIIRSKHCKRRGEGDSKPSPQRPGKTGQGGGGQSPVPLPCSACLRGSNPLRELCPSLLLRIGPRLAARSSADLPTLRSLISSTHRSIPPQLHKWSPSSRSTVVVGGRGSTCPERGSPDCDPLPITLQRSSSSGKTPAHSAPPLPPPPAFRGGPKQSVRPEYGVTMERFGRSLSQGREWFSPRRPAAQ